MSSLDFFSILESLITMLRTTQLTQICYSFQLWFIDDSIFELERDTSLYFESRSWTRCADWDLWSTILPKSSCSFTHFTDRPLVHSNSGMSKLTFALFDESEG